MVDEPDPQVLAARVAARAAIVVAVIGATATVIVAILGVVLR